MCSPHEVNIVFYQGLFFILVKMQALISHFLVKDERLCVVASWSYAFFGA